MSLKSDVVFNEIKERIGTVSLSLFLFYFLLQEPELVKKVSSSFRIIVNGEDGTVKKWTVDTKSSPASVDHDDKKNVEVEMTVKDADFMLIAAGKLKPDQAFMQGKLKLKGNIAKAMKLKTLLDPKMLKSKL